MTRFQINSRARARPFYLIIFFVALVFCVSSGRVLVAQGKGVSPRTGFRAPNFVVKDLEGTEISLEDQLGKPVFINFFATWCTFCRVEMPYIQALYEELGDQIAFIIIDLRESRETVEKFFTTHGWTVPVYLDATAASGARYAVRGIPASFFIDEEGIIREMAIGALSEERLRQGLELILP